MRDPPRTDPKDDQTRATSSEPEPGRITLHITPFNRAILPTIINNPTLRACARNISYHTVQTFPEADYGFVDLPLAEAQRLKKKFHGSILKGRKVRVEEARPRRISWWEEQAEGPSGVAVGSEDRPRKRAVAGKRVEGVLPGLVLPNNRRVRRGWATPRAAATRASGQRGKEIHVKGSGQVYGSQLQCLFRVRAPAHVLARLKQASAKMGKRRSKSASNGAITVREFAATSKMPSFVKEHDAQQHGGKPAARFEDGKGWVDEEGNVVEAVSRRSSKKPKIPGLDARMDEDVTREHLEAEECPIEDGPASAKKRKRSKDGAGSRDAGKTVETSETRPSNASEPGKEGGGSTQRAAPNLSITIPTPAATLPLTGHAKETHKARAIHPLESIFKKPALPNQPSNDAPKTTIEAEVEAPFSFFGRAHEAEEEPRSTAVPPGLQVPATPFTQQDFQYRGIRSAAPTPDTAAPGKRFSFAWRREDDNDEDEDEAEQDRDVDEDGDDDDDGGMVDDPDQHEGDGGAVGGSGGVEDDQMFEPAAAAAVDAAVDDDDDGDDQRDGAETTTAEPREKGFEQLFWEKRAQANRAWRRRRRETGKVKRRLENRRLTRRVQ